MAYNSFINKQVGIQSPTFRFQKDRNNGAVLAGDGLGEFQFYGFDGTNYLLTSAITSTASGTIAANRIGSNLEFYTHPDSVTVSTQRMVISNVGEVTINTPDTTTPALMVTNNGTGPNINLRTANNGVNDSPHIHFTKSRAGTADVQAGDDLGRLEFRGFQGGTAIEAVDIRAQAETVNGASVSGSLQFRTRPTTFAAIATRMTVSADGNVTIATPVSGTALTISGGGQSVLGAISLNATGTANTNINGTSNSGTVNIGNTSSGAITIDCGTAGISVGTTANAHTTTIGSTNTTSSTIIRSGTGNIIANTGLTVDSTGRMTNAVQPSFHATVSVAQNNVTGNANFYTVIFQTERFDIGNNYNNATGVFTAPVTGRYLFTSQLLISDLNNTMNLAQYGFYVNGAAFVGGLSYLNPWQCFQGLNAGSMQNTSIMQLNAGDTVVCQIYVNAVPGALVVDVGVSTISFFAGQLLS